MEEMGNFLSDTINEVMLIEHAEDPIGLPASKFTCIDLCQASPDDLEVFEVVLGRQDGSIWHGCFQGTKYALEVFDPLTKMIPGEGLGLKPVIDIKIV